MGSDHLSPESLTRAKEYKMIFDYHTHTVFSHGKGTIEDNVREAISKGLKGIAISDHGPGHLTYGVKRENLPVMRAEIESLKTKYPEIEILLSVEANIIYKNPFIDLKEEDKEHLDFVLAGYHFGVTKGNCIGNWLDSHIGYPAVTGDKLKLMNTDMTVAAVYENDLKILTHPGDKGRFDIKAIARACEDKGTWMELNMKHPFLDIEGIKTASKFDVTFVISSDAHIPERVGTFETALARAFDAGLEPERIINIAKLNR